MSVSATAVRCDESTLWVELSDGRILGVPLAWFPRLLSASQQQLAAYELSLYGIHWDELDVNLSVEGLLLGQEDRRCHTPFGPQVTPPTR